MTKLEQLSQVQMFSTLNKAELGLIAKAAEVVTVKAGTVIVTEGTNGHDFYRSWPAGDGPSQRAQVTTLDSGRYFGELALLDKGRRSATVVAETDHGTAVIGQREFLGVLDQVPAVTEPASEQPGGPAPSGGHQSRLVLSSRLLLSSRSPLSIRSGGSTGRRGSRNGQSSPPGPSSDGGVAAGPATTACSSTWATSSTLTDSAADPSAWRALVASSSMIRQYGQAVEITSAPVPRASSVRLTLIRWPMRSSSHMRAPPAPQQNPVRRCRCISVTSTPGTWLSTPRGSS